MSAKDISGPPRPSAAPTPSGHASGSPRSGGKRPFHVREGHFGSTQPVISSNAPPPNRALDKLTRTAPSRPTRPISPFSIVHLRFSNPSRAPPSRRVLAFPPFSSRPVWNGGRVYGVNQRGHAVPLTRRAAKRSRTRSVPAVSRVALAHEPEPSARHLPSTGP